MAEPQLAVYPALTESVPRCTAIDPSQLPALPNLLRIGPPTCGATLAYTGMSPTLGAPTTQRRQTTLRFEGRLGLSGLPPPEFGSPTGGLPPPPARVFIAIGPLASANRSPWLQELIRHYTRIYCCLPHLKIEKRRYACAMQELPPARQRRRVPARIVRRPGCAAALSVGAVAARPAGEPLGQRRPRPPARGRWRMGRCPRQPTR